MGAEYNDGEGGARLRERLASGPPLLLDGATGTELESRGVPAALPLWSAWALIHAPDALAEIHAEYAAAGAEVLTANTFRTQERTLARAQQGGRARELTALAASLAREAARRSPDPALVAGSAPPLEDCYRPDKVPDDEALAREHAAHAQNLARAGVDLILVETMNCTREAGAAARAAAATGLPFFASFVTWERGRLLSGEPLAEGIEAALRFGPSAVLVNCLPPSAVPAALDVLRAAAGDLPFGVYANLGAPTSSGARSEPLSADAFAHRALEWAALGARLLGGCCGTRPAHIHALHEGIAAQETSR